MTDKPKTLALSTRQWRVLLNDNLDVLKAAVQSTEAINEDGYKQFCTQLDDMKLLAGAWYKVSVPAAPVEDNPVQEGSTEKARAVFEGAPKKRRGRPTNAEKAAAAQAVQ